MPGKHVIQKLKLEDAAVEHNLDPFGQVSHGWIRVTGPLIENQPLWGRRDNSIIDSVYLEYPSEIIWRAFLMFGCLLLGEREWKKG